MQRQLKIKVSIVSSWLVFPHTGYGGSIRDLRELDNGAFQVRGIPKIDWE